MSLSCENMKIRLVSSVELANYQQVIFELKPALDIE